MTYFKGKGILSMHKYLLEHVFGRNVGGVSTDLDVYV